MDENTTEQDISFSKIGKPINLLCKDEEKINEIRLKFIDYDIKLFELKN